MITDMVRQAIGVSQLKIVVHDTSPLAWHRVLITSAATIATVHVSVQTTMGWEDVRLHQVHIVRERPPGWDQGLERRAARRPGACRAAARGQEDD